MLYSTTAATHPGTLLAVMAGLTLFTAQGALAQQNTDAPPPAVLVMTAKAEEVSRSQQFVGRIRAIQSVDLVARVEGFLDTISFDEGSTVSDGETMFKIETAPYDAALAAAQGQLAAAQAQLAGAKANLKNADVTLQRQVTLAERGTVSEATRDDAQASRDVAEAQVQQAEAAVKQAEASVQTAELNLGYTTISSPIAGRVGAVNITEGNLVTTQSGTLATVVQLDPIRVAFSIPEAAYSTFASNNTASETTNGEFKPSLILPNGKEYDEDGAISFISNEIDQATGTLVIYADFPNPKSVLLPGSFVTVTVDEADATRLPVIPASAILQDKDGDYVFVLDGDNRAQQRRVETGQQMADGIPVSKGLAEGDTVVVEGLQKISAGQVVTPRPATPSELGTGSAATTATTASSPAEASAAAPPTAGDGTPPQADVSGSAQAAPTQ